LPGVLCDFLSPIQSFPSREIGKVFNAGNHILGWRRFGVGLSYGRKVPTAKTPLYPHSPLPTLVVMSTGFESVDVCDSHRNCLQHRTKACPPVHAPTSWFASLLSLKLQLSVQPPNPGFRSLAVDGPRPYSDRIC